MRVWVPYHLLINVSLHLSEPLCPKRKFRFEPGLLELSWGFSLAFSLPCTRSGVQGARLLDFSSLLPAFRKSCTLEVPTTVVPCRLPPHLLLAPGSSQTSTTAQPASTHLKTSLTSTMQWSQRPQPVGRRRTAGRK